MAHSREASFGTINKTFSINKELRDRLLMKLETLLNSPGYSVNLYTEIKDSGRRDSIPAGAMTNITVVPTDIEYARAVKEKEIVGGVITDGFYTSGAWFDGANTLKITFTLESTSGDQTFKFLTLYTTTTNKVIGHGSVEAGRVLVANTPQTYQIYVKV